jgi:hypothetical protein
MTQSDTREISQIRKGYSEDSQSYTEGKPFYGTGNQPDLRKIYFLFRGNTTQKSKDGDCRATIDDHECSEGKVRWIAELEAQKAALHPD